MPIRQLLSERHNRSDPVRWHPVPNSAVPQTVIPQSVHREARRPTIQRRIQPERESGVRRHRLAIHQLQPATLVDRATSGAIPTLRDAQALSRKVGRVHRQELGLPHKVLTDEQT